ncbi:MAG: isopentenyl phosphate kinase [Acidobacteriota bacterium]
MSRRPLVVVKLGGSLLTDKSSRFAAREAVVARLAAEASEARADLDGGLLIGHGSGSFGHVAAQRHGLGRHAYDGRPFGIAAVQHAAAELHRRVTSALVEAEVPAWSWVPSTGLVADNGQPRDLALDALEAALDRQLVPIVYGDVALDASRRATIVSTEILLDHLCRRMMARGWSIARLLWLGETDGVYDRDGRTIAVLDGAADWRRAFDAAGGSSGTDVTGGMRHRLQAAQALAELGVESWIIDGSQPEVFARALRGEDVGGTRCVPRSPAAR